MAAGNGKLTEKQVADWFGGLEFARQMKVLAGLSDAHDKGRTERVNALKRELATLEKGEVKLNGRKAKPSAVKAKVKAKYRDPSTGDTWSGRGRMSNWLAKKVKAGEKATKYLVK